MRSFVVKEQIVSRDKTGDKVLEKAVAFSKFGKIGKIPVLRPMLSQYSVWFDGKRYVSEMKIDPEAKKLTVNLDSEEKQWTGDTGIFYSQGDWGLLLFSSGD